MKFVEDKMLAASQLPKRTIALVLAGGRGTRLHQLTDNRAKPAVYFGGKFRIIDFALSNCINSGIRRVGVITQYRPHSLIRHLQRGWSFLRGEQNEFIDLMPAGQQMEEGLWYRGTADAVAQNKGILRSYGPEYILVLAGDHIYKMDYSLLLLDHVERKSQCTVACIEVPRMDATGFGVMDVDENRRITRFLEKPADPPGIPDRPDKALASMGIYVFNADYLYRLLDEDCADNSSSHDFGKDIIPKVVGQGNAMAHYFSMSCIPPAQFVPPYWRDVGMDGVISNTMVSGGCIICGSKMSNTILFSKVRVQAFCNLDQVVVLPDCEIGQGSRLKKVVIDRGCRIPEGTIIGEDPELDAQRFYRSPNGVVLVTQEMFARLYNFEHIPKVE